MKKILNPICEFLTEYNIPLTLFGLYILITRMFDVPNCLVKLTIGYPCPACGMSRAVFSILGLDFIGALKYNPIVILLPLILIIIVYREYTFFKKLYSSKILWVGFFLVVLICYIVRLILVYPEIPLDYNKYNVLNLIFSLFKG